MDRYPTEQIVAALAAEAKEAVYGILGRVELLARESLSPRQRAHLQVCSSAADRVLRITEDLGRLCGPEASDPSEWEPCRPSQVSDRLARVLGPVAQIHDQSFQISLAPDVPASGLCQLDRTEDLLTRLVLSCLRPGSSGNLEVTIRGGEGGASDSLQFEIRNSSGALPFDSASLADSLPLHIAARMAEKLGGSLTLPETGSADPVVFKVPFRPAANTQSSSKPAVAAGEGSPALSILIAEDNDDSYRLLNAYLKGTGHALTRALDGLVAVELATTRHFDLVFMDINMPKLDGFSAARSIREWESRNHRAPTPILVLSAEQLDEQKRRGSLAGCSGYLVKPLTRKAFLSAIEHYANPVGETTLGAG